MDGEKTKKSNSLVILILSVLLMLVCVIGGLYALYTSGDIESSSAKAAKWGVTVSAQGDDSGTFKSTYDGNSDISVVSSDQSKLVAAPGTSGSLTFSVTGTPEVAVSVSVSLGDENELSMITGPVDADAQTKEYTYYPIQWTLKQSATKPDDWSKVTAVTNCESVSLSAINNYLTDTTNVSKSWDANTNLTTKYGYYQLSWSWPATADPSKDDEDTYIGNVAAGTVSDSYVVLTESFKLNISVKQLDTYTGSAS